MLTNIINGTSDKSFEFIIATLGSIASLAWNSALVDLINKMPQLKRYGMWIYAIIITFIYVKAINLRDNKKKIESNSTSI